MSRRGIAWLEVLVIVTIAFVLMWFLFPVPGGNTKEGAIATQCLSNLKQLGVAATAYAADNADKLPVKNWMKATLPYSKNEEAYSCPVVALSGLKGGYALNAETSGQKASSEKSEDNRILYFETSRLGKDQVLNVSKALKQGRHGIRITVVYADNRVRNIKPSDISLPPKY